MTAPLPAMPKKRGRPAKWAKVEIDREGNPVLPEAKKAKVPLTDEQILALVKDRFDVMAKMVRGMVDRKVRSFIISGAPGVGKTFTIEQILEEAAGDVKKETKYTIIRGTMTAINLHRTLFKMRKPGNITVLDDTDGIFGDENALNILKAAVDTSKHRRLSYMSDSFTGGELTEDGDEVPQQFDYEGSMIFISNIDFDAYLEAGKNRVTPHLQALLNRSLYLDLRIHGKRELSLWIGHVLRASKVLQGDFALTEDNVQEILDYLSKRQGEVRSLSIRSAIQCAGLMKMEPETWKKSADVLLLKGKK